MSCSQQAELIASKIAFAQAIAPRAPVVPVEYPLSTLGQRALEYRCESPQSGTTEDRIRRDNRTALTLVFPSACDPPPAPLGTAAVLIASPEACHLQSEGERLELSKMLTNSKALGEKLRQDMAKLEVQKPSLSPAVSVFGEFHGDIVAHFLKTIENSHGRRSEWPPRCTGAAVGVVDLGGDDRQEEGQGRRRRQGLQGPFRSQVSPGARAASDQLEALAAPLNFELNVPILAAASPSSY